MGPYQFFFCKGQCILFPFIVVKVKVRVGNRVRNRVKVRVRFKVRVKVRVRVRVRVRVVEGFRNCFLPKGESCGTGYFGCRCKAAGAIY